MAGDARILLASRTLGSFTANRKRHYDHACSIRSLADCRRSLVMPSLATAYLCMLRNTVPRASGWTILREDNGHVPIMQSLVTFRSIADAHVAGTVALGKFKTYQALSAKSPESLVCPWRQSNGVIAGRA